MSTPRFHPKAIAFLRGLKRNNNREWFNPRKDQYDELLRKPMLDVIERLAVDLRTIAPELSATPRSLFRIYRDTRFSPDKSPYKTHVSASFPHKTLPRHGGAGMYFEIGPTGTWAGGGIYAPDTPLLQAEREHIATNLKRFRAIVESPAFTRHVSGVEGGELLQRVPRGFAPDHPAGQYLRFRMFVAGREFPAGFAASKRFYPGLLDVFSHLAPFIRFLNEPLTRH